MEVSGRRTGPFEDISSAEDGELFCQPCGSEDDWVVAKGYCQNCNEYYCAACLKPHRKQSVTKHHVILEGEHMPKSTSLRVGTESSLEICLKHSNEIIKFYCPSHDTIGCSDCMVLDHKPCKVKRIHDISRDYCSGPEHRQLLGKVQGLLEKIDEIRSSIAIAGVDIKTSYRQALADFKAFRTEINDYLDKVQGDILSEVKERKKNDEMTIAQTTAEHQSLRQEIESFEEKLQQQSNKASTLFVAAKQMTARMSSFESTINKLLQDSTIKQYKFEPSLDMKKILSSEGHFGKLTENIKQGSSQKKLADMDVQFDGEINVKTTEDTEDCRIYSSALISPSHIVLADYNNECLKIVDIAQRKLSSSQNLPSKPLDVAVVSRDLIVVTLPYVQKLRFLLVTKQKKLIENYDIEVNGNVSAIACQDDYFIIGYDRTIEIRTMQGKVVRLIMSKDLSKITSIATAPDSLTFYVANSGGTSPAIYKFDLKGNKLASYKDYTLPDFRGITVTSDGTVLACKWSDNGSIHLISPDCKKIKEVMPENEHVEYRYCITFCNESRTLFLCNYHPDIAGRYSNFLKLFKML